MRVPEGMARFTSEPGLRSARLIAETLSGAWRDSELEPVHFSGSDLDEVTPFLCVSGTAALAWRRVGISELANSASAEVLHQAYRLQSLQSDIQEQKVEKLFRLLRQASVDAILAKGWAAGGLYPDRALRPFGDFDICVPPGQFAIARDVFCSPEAQDCWVDLHKQFGEIGERRFDELFARSQLIPLGEEQIRILSPEDHLALLSIHLLKHGAWRPLWLCDIAAAVESLPESFDWDVCLGRTNRRAEWISCTIGLANQLLGAKIDGLPHEVKSANVPAWMTKNVLFQWSILLTEPHLPMTALPLMSSHLKQGRDILKAALKRWPDPITATFNLKGKFNNFPRAPYQVLDFLRLTTRYLIEAPVKLRSEDS